MNVYLDIDGVIMANDREPARHVHEFLEYVVSKYQAYWLTTHCYGDLSYTTHHLSQWLKPETLKLAAKIRPTDWQVFKTEAIDWKIPFLWFDDQLFDFGKADLVKHRVLDSWIEVDFSRDVDQLQKIVRNFPRPAVSLNWQVAIWPGEINLTSWRNILILLVPAAEVKKEKITTDCILILGYR